jgi:hypothetical protein
MVRPGKAVRGMEGQAWKGTVMSQAPKCCEAQMTRVGNDGDGHLYYCQCCRRQVRDLGRVAQRVHFSALESYEPSKQTEPTCVAPGTRDKVQVLAARVAAGEELYHADDRDDFEGISPSVVKPREMAPATEYQCRTVRIATILAPMRRLEHEE